MVTNVEWIEKQVKGTLAVEDIIPSLYVEQQVTRKFLKGSITSEEAIKKIKRYWGVKEKYI